MNGESESKLFCYHDINCTLYYNFEKKIKTKQYEKSVTVAQENSENNFYENKTCLKLMNGVTMNVPL